MQFKIKTKSLLSMLRLIGSVIPRKAPLPVLEDFHLSLADGRLTAEATNGDIFIKTPITVIEATPGTAEDILVPAAQLLELLSTIESSREIIIETEGPEVLKVIWNNGDGHARLPLFDMADWPAPVLPKADRDLPVNALAIDAGAVLDALQHTLASTIDDASKPALEAVLLDLKKDGVSYAVSSDTRVLARYPLAADTGVDAQVLLPADAGKLVENITAFLLRATDDKESALQVVFTSDSIRTLVAAGDFQLVCHHPTGRFPDYEKIFPPETKTPLIIEKKALLDSIQHCSAVMTGESALQISLHGNAISTSMHDVMAQASIQENLQFCDYAGPDIDIAFNAKKLAETLSLFRCEELRMDFTGPTRPALMRSTADDSEPLAVILMPVKVSSK